MFLKTFTSPINRDDGTRHAFIGHARSIMHFVTTEDGLLGMICWKFTYIDGRRNGESEHRDITLYFDHNKRLTYFENTHELPDEAIELLEDSGFTCEIAKV